jgi:hypothetical protein
MTKWKRSLEKMCLDGKIILKRGSQNNVEEFSLDVFN